MTKEHYAYAVARMRVKEVDLLSENDYLQFLNMKKEKDILSVLTDRGWGKGEMDFQDLLQCERKKTWELLFELVPDQVLWEPFLLLKDCWRIKALIKEMYTHKVLGSTYHDKGFFTQEQLEESIREQRFEQIQPIGGCAMEAYTMQFYTGNSQLAEAVLDKGALQLFLDKTRQSKEEAIKQYGENYVAVKCIMIGMRSLHLHKKIDFLDNALPSCETFPRKKLIEAILGGEEIFYEYLASTTYSEGIEYLKKSLGAFEKWSDDYLLELFEKQKSNPFTLGPLIGYLIARENELKSIGILVLGKRNGLSEAIIRERLRKAYV